MHGAQKIFFNSIMKKNNNKLQRNYSSSNSQTNNYKSSKSLQKKNISHLILSKKQQQIREAIQYRFVRSKMREYVFKMKNLFVDRQPKSPKSSQMQEYQELKQLKMISIREFHEKEPIKRKDQLRNNLIKRLRMKTDHSLVMKTQNDKSVDRIPFLYQQFNETIKSSSRTPVASGYKFTYMQAPITEPNKKSESANRKLKPELSGLSYRILTPKNQNQNKTRIRSLGKEWKLSPKSKQCILKKNYCC